MKYAVCILIITLNLCGQYDWTAPVKLSNNGINPDNYYWLPTIVTDYNNTIYAFWVRDIEIVEWEYYSQIECRKSFDSGLTWSPIENITPESTIGRLYHIEAVCDSSNNVHILYETNYTCIYKKYDGDSWSPPITVTNNHFSTPRLGIDHNDVLYATWYGGYNTCFSTCDARSDSIKWSAYEIVSEDDNFIHSNLIFDRDNNLYAGGNNTITNIPCFFKYNSADNNWSVSTMYNDDALPLGLTIVDNVIHCAISIAKPFSSENGVFLMSKTLNDSLWSVPSRINYFDDYSIDSDLYHDSEGNLHLFESWDGDFTYSRLLNSEQVWTTDTVQSDLIYGYYFLDVSYNNNNNMFYAIYEKYEHDTHNTWIYFQSKKNETGIEISDDISVSDFELYQNFPNPFNNETSIEFSLDKTSRIELNVYNSKGEFVQNLVSDKLNKGKHNFSFIADKLNSGVYFYRLSVEGIAKETKKMLYLK